MFAISSLKNPVVTYSATQLMVHVFTTFFQFQSRTYVAVITRISNAIEIYFPDESLRALLPEGRLRQELSANDTTDNMQVEGRIRLLLKAVLNSLKGQQLAQMGA